MSRLTSSIIPLYPLVQRRPGDMFLCSYPKSGRTWVRQFLAQYMSLTYDLGYTAKYDLLKLMTIVPAEWWLASNPSGFKYDMEIPRIRCSHFLPDERFYNMPVVRLSRNFLDTLVSYYYHEERPMTISQFVRAKIHELIYYHLAWHAYAKANLATILYLTYEGLVTNPRASFGDLVAFLNLPFDEGILQTAMERSSFDSMRRDQEGTKELRVRRGKIEGYWDVLGNSDIQFIQDIVRKSGLESWV